MGRSAPEIDIIEAQVRLASLARVHFFVNLGLVDYSRLIVRRDEAKSLNRVNGLLSMLLISPATGQGLIMAWSTVMSELVRLPQSYDWKHGPRSQ